MGPHRRFFSLAVSFVVAVLVTVAPAGVAFAAVSVTRAEVSGSQLRMEGTATANRDITVDGGVMGRSDAGGKFKIDRTGYTPPPDCTVDVNDFSATPRTVALSGCTVTSPPPPSAQQSPTPLSPANGASVTTPVTLSWSQVLDPGSLNGGYNWRISTTSTFTTLVARDSTSPAVMQDSVGGLVAGTYFWQVQAVSASLVSSDWSAARSFTVTGPGAGALAAPVLDPLPFGAHYFPMEHWPFRWSAVAGAASYTVEASRDPAFPVPVDVRLSNEPGPTSGFTFDHTLIDTWYLRVYAVDSNGVAGAPSNVQSFIISYNAPIGPPPTLASPVNGASLTLPVTLDWNDVENPQNRGYHVQVATDSAFQNEEVLIPFRSESQVTLVDLTPGTKFWRVRHAEGDNSPTTAAFTDFSPVRSFTVANTAPAVTSISLLGRTAAFSGTEQVGEIQLSAVAPPGGAVVSLTSTHPAATPVPSSVTIPAGAAFTQFRFFYGHVTAPVTATITASYAGSSASVAVRVDPPELKEILPSPNAVTGGAPASGMIALNGSAPPEGAVVTLSSNSPLVVPPASVTLASGSFFGPFTMQTSAVSATTSVTITGEWKGKQVTHLLTLQPGVPPDTWTLEKSVVTGSEGSTARVSVASAQSTDTTFTLTSSNTTVARMPSIVTVPAGALATSVIVSTTAPTSTTAVTLSVSGAGVTRTATLTVNPFPAAPLPAPTLLAPTNGARLAPNVSTAFDWSDVSSSATYTLQVSTSSAFTSVALERTVTASTVALSFGTEGDRWWRVRADDAGGSPGAWSATRSFRVKR